MEGPSPRIYFDPPATEFDPPATETRLLPARDDRTLGYLEKIAQLVPIEGGYKASTLLVPAIQPARMQPFLYWGLFVLGLLGTLWYVGWQIGPGIKKQRHLWVYGAAFVVWAYATTGDKLLPAPYYQDAVAGIVLVVASLIFGKIKLPKIEQSG
jgi:hypothetical protein